MYARATQFRFVGEPCLEFFVIDVANAFKLIPARPEERKWLGAVISDVVYIYLVLVFGLESAPLVWSRAMALISRLTQGFLHTSEARLSVYIDDPILVCAGPPEDRARSMAVVLLFWGALGLPLAWHKSSVGQKVNYIGAKVSHARAQRSDLGD